MSYNVVEFEPGEVIFRQGDQGTMMYLVQKGEVEVLQEMGGTETQVATLGRSDFFGEMSLLENAERTHTLRALSQAKLVQIDRPAFSQMLSRNPDIAVRMVKKLSARLATTEDMVIRAYNSLEAAHKGVTERVVAGHARLIGLTNDFETVLPQQHEVAIGRLDPANNIHPDVDLTTIDPQISTSRRHAKIFRRADIFFIQEEQTTNGTLVNDQRISAERPIELRHNDLITFGAVRMRFVVE